MSFYSNKLTSLAIVFVFSITVLAGCGGNGSENNQQAKNSNGDSSVAIKAGSESISMSEFNQQLDQRMQRIKKRLSQLPKAKQKKQLQRYRKRFKTQLAQQQQLQLTLKHFVKQSDISVSDQEVNEKFNQITKQFPSQKALKQALKKQGQSVDSIKEKIREQVRQQKFINQELGEIDVSPEEAENYYENNKKEFDKPEKVKASHILIKDDTGAKKKIDDLKNRLDDGADFQELARNESEGPSSKQDGDLGFITRDRMVKPFSDAAFSLNIGEVSDPVETRYGWHLIKVTDKKEAESAKYDDVEDTIVQQVRKQKKQKKTEKLLQELQGKIDIVNNVSEAGLNKKKSPVPATPGS